MSLPDKIVRFLNARMLASRRPLCLRISSDDRLIESWGDMQHYGLEALGADDDVGAALGFLAGCDAVDALELPFVSDDHGHTYHAHVIADGETRLVLLLDAADELRQRQRYQQTANEVKLLLERERRLIADLVDAKAELVVRRKEAEDESRRRGEYIATMSHEFRTPLTTIVSQAQRLRRDDASAEIAERAGSIERLAHDQLWLIDNLLSRARLDAEGFAIHCSVTDVRGLVDELALVFAPLAADKALSFGAWVATDVPAFAMLDVLHVRQVLVNLLGNAIKYTGEGTVSLEIERRAGHLRFRVSDTGPGIAADDQVAIFAPFNRGRETPQAPGAGLGLGIARQLVEAMGGTLVMDSAPGAGTRVSFELRAEALGDAKRTAPAHADELIVVGEDDPDICDLLEVRLGEAHYRVECVGDGEALVAAALERAPSLVIVDVNMPRLDGPAAARTLRERGFAAPIVALSGAARRQDIEHALASGCTEFVRKPPQMGALKRLIERLILADRSGAAPEVERRKPEGKQM